MSNKFKIHCFHGKLRKKREANQIQTESKACVTTSNFAAKARLLASVESCRNQFRRLVWIWSAKRARAWTNELFSRIWAISNASCSTELLHSKKWSNFVNNRNSSRAARFKGQSKILCHSESRQCILWWKQTFKTSARTTASLESRMMWSCASKIFKIS